MIQILFIIQAAAVILFKREALEILPRKLAKGDEVNLESCAHSELALYVNCSSHLMDNSIADA